MGEEGPAGLNGTEGPPGPEVSIVIVKVTQRLFWAWMLISLLLLLL